MKVPNKFYDYATDIFEAIEDKNTTKQYLAEFLYEIYEEGCDLGEKTEAYYPRKSSEN